MASVFSTTDLENEYGKYYLKEGQNQQRLHRALLQMPVTLEKHARHIRTTETIYRMANYTFGSLIRPFKATFQPNSNVEFFANEIVLRKMKADVSMTPDEIEEGWLGFMSGDTTRNKKDWPIVRWLMEEYIANQIGVDRELNMVYKGQYDADGTTPSTCMDGIKTLLYNGARNEKYPINVINGVGALDKDAIFDQIEAFDEALPGLYQQQVVCIFMAPSWARAYKKDKRAQNFYFIEDLRDLDETVMFTKHVIVGLPSMEGTNDLWATVPDNLLWLTKREGGVEKADVQAHDYDVHIMVNWWEGIGFACNKMVWATAETVELPSAVDTAKPEDGIIARNIFPATFPAEQVADTTATLAGKVYGEDVPADAVVKFNYGTTSAMGTSADAVLADGKYTAALTSLSDDTKYYFQIVVSIGTDSYPGEVETFTTEETPTK